MQYSNKEIIHVIYYDSQGLINDAGILEKSLLAMGFNVTLICHSAMGGISKRQYDIHSNAIFFLEHIHPGYINNDALKIFIPNLEWMHKVDIKLMGYMDCLLAKTNISYNVLLHRFPEIKILKWGWTSVDRYIEHIKPSHKCLHVKGSSCFKNSQKVLDLWLSEPDLPELNIVSYGLPEQNGFLEIRKPVKISHNIILWQWKLDEKQLSSLMNACAYHICPSYAEGYGHYINEALSVGASVLSVDCPPMNELVSNDYGVLIKSRIVNIKMGQGNEIKILDLKKGVKKLLSGKRAERQLVRNIYLDKKSAFLKNLMQGVSNMITSDHP